MRRRVHNGRKLGSNCQNRILAVAVLLPPKELQSGIRELFDSIFENGTEPLKTCRSATEGAAAARDPSNTAVQVALPVEPFVGSEIFPAFCSGLSVNSS